MIPNPDLSRIVSEATFFPACCEVCMGQKGPFWDTGVDRPIGPSGARADLHVYICVSCLKDATKLAGWTPGERLDQLENAAEERDGLERKLHEAEATARKLALAADDAAKRIAAQDEENEFLAGRVRQLEDRIKAHAEADMDLVG